MKLDNDRHPSIYVHVYIYYIHVYLYTHKHLRGFVRFMRICIIYTRFNAEDVH